MIIWDFVTFVSGGFSSYQSSIFPGKGWSHHRADKIISAITGNVTSTQHLNFLSLCFPTGLGLWRELTARGRCLTSSLQIQKALCVLAAPQCPTEIECEEKSSWQDLRLGTEAARRISSYVVRTIP